MRTELVGALGMALLLHAPAAHADGPGLELSRDGSSWSGRLTAPVLDEEARLVPGGRTSGDLWARNSSGRTTTMTVVVREVTTTMPATARSGDRFRVRVGSTTVPTSGRESCQEVRRDTLRPGERARIPVSVSLPWGSGDVSEDRTVTIPLSVQLVEGVAGDPCGETPPSGPDDPGTAPDDPGAGPDEPGAAPGGDVAKNPPERPGRVQTDGGPWGSPALEDLLGPVLLLLLVGCAVARRYRHVLRRRLLSWRGRARRVPPAS